LEKPGPERQDSRYRALATDYDGTLAEKGRVEPATLAALRRLKSSGWLLLLVTGRHLEDLLGVFPEAEVCDLIVAENGALLFAPPEGRLESLAPPPPPRLLEELERRGVGFSTGRTVISTTRPYAPAVGEAAALLGLDLELSLNKEALMVLPKGVDKRSGLLAALAELHLSPAEVVGVGDAENDIPFLQLCGHAVAVANALPAVVQAADLATTGERGAGVRELVERLLGTCN
jgi:hydroxymethylpyrimidine pyrophosphatase-like HAD family hydrolase